MTKLTRDDRLELVLRITDFIDITDNIIRENLRKYREEQAAGKRPWRR